ncbi:MAG: hypothetical protein HY774_20665 [Acidobacteria bacterium]|nr:hypothetical protein [Acidobacteriota bacterium]
MICSNCKTLNPDTHVSCAECGTPLKARESIRSVDHFRPVNQVSTPTSVGKCITWEGHQVRFFSFLSPRYWYFATEMYLYVDGKLLGTAGGFGFVDSIECQITHQRQKVQLRVTTGPSLIPMFENYRVFINDRLIDKGRMRVFFGLDPNLHQKSG